MKKPITRELLVSFCLLALSLAWSFTVSAQTTVSASYGQLQLSFEANNRSASAAKRGDVESSAASKPAASKRATTLTFADRVAYQQAIEGVYWRHRIWPKENPRPKPALDAVMSEAQIEKKVEDYMRKSQALEDHWHGPITAEQLQSEMERMVQHTQQPDVLRELFEALDNDPFVVAECLARPALAERLSEKLQLVDDSEGELTGEGGRRKNEDKALRRSSFIPDPSSLIHDANYTLPAILLEAGSGCTLDAWTATSMTNVPDARYGQTAVWTGSEMIVWGADNGYYNTGGKYNPSTDSWAATTTTNAPSPRGYHSAVWTGSEMIVWGGFDASGFLNTGGRYNPGSDSWIPTSTTNAAAARAFQTAVWTGTEMIVWGGNYGSLNTGGRYNPSSDSWAATSTTNAPSARYNHTAVWTGSEMIVWGGTGGGNTGGRYNPSTDSWTATSTTGASPAANHTAVWTGTEMIVWGGVWSFYMNTGGRYNPSTDSWTSTTTTGAPDPRVNHTAVWTGSEMIVWGGYLIYQLDTGGRYNPSTDSWTATSITNVPQGRGAHSAVWTGSEMIVWGGVRGILYDNLLNDGGRYCAQPPSPPTISKSFGAASIQYQASTTLSFTITNPNTTLAETGVAFSDTLPSGLTVATSSSTVCGGTLTTTNATGVILLSGATVAASSSCTFSVNVTGASLGVMNNTTGAVSSTEGGTGTTSNTATLTVVAPPPISKVFGAASVPLNGSTSLSFTVTNPNTSVGLTGIGFTDTLPAGLVISTPNGLTGSCGGGTITAAAGVGSVSLSGAMLVGSASCAFSVNVKGTTAGTKNNTTGAVSSTNGGTGTTSNTATLTVVTPPTIQVVFNPTTVAVGGTTTLTFTLTNPAANTVAETGVALADTLPTGLVVATPNGLTNSCGGTVTANAGSGSISLTGGSITTPGTTCTISLNVTGTTVGVKNDMTGAVSSTNGGTGITSNTATLTVAEEADLAIQKTAVRPIKSPPQLQVGSNLVYNITVTNLGPTAATGVNWSDTLPPGLSFVSMNSPALWTCGVTGGGVVSCTKSTAMAVNETVNFALIVVIACGQATGTQISNTALVSFPGIDPVPANNSSRDTVTVANPPAILTPATASFRSRGGTGSIMVAQSSTCPLTAISDAAFLTIASTSSGTGAGLVTYTVATNPSSTTRNGTLTIAGQTFTVTQTAVTPDNSQTMCFNLPGGGDSTFSTPGTAKTVETGYAQVQSCTSKTAAFDAALTELYGTAVFSLTQDNAVVSEAGVPASVPTTAARLFIDYRPTLQAKGVDVEAGLISINTGIAVVNTGPVTANLVFTLRDGSGVTLTTGNATLAAGNHRALFIDQLNQWAADFAFPANFGTAVQFGTLTITSDQAVAVVALRSTLNQRSETLLTTTPVADLTKTPGSGPLYFPQLADGGGFTTALLLMNTNAATETGKINLFRNDGTGLQVHRIGDAAGTASTFSYSISAGGVYRFETDGTPGSVNTGSVQVVPDAGTTTPVGAGLFHFAPPGNLFSSQTVVTESGVPAATPTTHALIYVDQSNGHMTGLAIAAPTVTPVHVTLRALQSDGATVVGLGSLDLVGNGHDACFVQEFITGLPAGFTGVLEILTPSPVAVLTLRALVNIRGEMLLTTFPVADFNQPAPGLLFPQIADGGGFQTQIILLNAGPAPQYVKILYFGDDGLPLDVAK
jgi:uncharacterized repeat protein (TIGR01451 family)/fimbrial isopeptide formation D2 family protein